MPRKTLEETIGDYRVGNRTQLLAFRDSIIFLAHGIPASDIH